MEIGREQFSLFGDFCSTCFCDTPQVEKKLSSRLQAGIQSWTECLKGDKSSRHMDDSMDTSMMAHKPGGDPDLLVS